MEYSNVKQLVKEYRGVSESVGRPSWLSFDVFKGIFSGLTVQASRIMPGSTMETSYISALYHYTVTTCWANHLLGDWIVEKHCGGWTPSRPAHPCEQHGEVLHEEP